MVEINSRGAQWIGTRGGNQSLGVSGTECSLSDGVETGREIGGSEQGGKNVHALAQAARTCVSAAAIG
jgi:hypothetical protein